MKRWNGGWVFIPNYSIISRMKSKGNFFCFVHEYKFSLRREVNRASSGRIPLKTPLESLFNFQGHTTLWVGFSSLVLNPKGRRGSSLMVFLILCSFPVLFSGLQHCVQYPPCISADLFLSKHKPSSALYCILLFSRIVFWICTNLLSILIALSNLLPSISCEQFKSATGSSKHIHSGPLLMVHTMAGIYSVITHAMLCYLFLAHCVAVDFICLVN